MSAADNFGVPERMGYPLPPTPTVVAEVKLLEELAKSWYTAYKLTRECLERTQKLLADVRSERDVAQAEVDRLRAILE